MTPLRQKMLELMHFRQLAPSTQKSYLNAVTQLSTHYQRSPETISADEVKSWLITRSAERQWSASTINLNLMAIYFCYQQVLEQGDFYLQLKLPKKPQKIPALLTKKEVYAILHATKNLKHLTILSLCYGCGLRVSEVVALTPYDIDSERLLLRVTQGKGKKDRNIPLSNSLLNLLRNYWQTHHSGDYLFSSNQQQKKTLGISSVQKLYKKAKVDAHIRKQGGIHGLRHAYATHQLAQGLPINQLQLFLGHSDIKVTMKYLHWVPQQTVIATDLLADFMFGLSKVKFTLGVRHEHV
jgi:site-specific recombinase XerD